MNNLNDLLEEHLSRRNRVFYAFGIGVGNCESSTSGAWTVVSLYIHGIVDRNGAIEALGSRARSRRIAGTLSANDAVRQMGTVEPTDGERTRPGTPRPDTEEVTRQVINIEL